MNKRSEEEKIVDVDGNDEIVERGEEEGGKEIDKRRSSRDTYTLMDSMNRREAVEVGIEVGIKFGNRFALGILLTARIESASIQTQKRTPPSAMRRQAHARTSRRNRKKEENKLKMLSTSFEADSSLLSFSFSHLMELSILIMLPLRRIDTAHLPPL